MALALEGSRPEPGLEPAHEAVEVVHREANRTRHVGRVGRHVRTFEDDRADIAVVLDEPAGGGDDVFARAVHIERVLIAEQHPRELRAALGPLDRGVRARARALKVPGGEAVRVHRHHPDALARRQQPFDPRRLQERRRGDRNPA